MLKIVYYVKARAYTFANKKIIYGKWSDIKVISIKNKTDVLLKNNYNVALH